MNLTILPNGVGFLPAAAAAAPAAGPVAPVVVAVAAIASFFKGLFGGGPPPPPLTSAQLARNAAVENITGDLYRNLITVKRLQPKAALNLISSLLPLNQGEGAYGPKLLDYLLKNPGLVAAEKVAQLQSALKSMSPAPVATTTPTSQQQQSFLPSQPSQPTQLPDTAAFPSVLDVISDALSKIIKPPPIPAYQPIPGEPAPPPPPASQQQQTGKSAGQVARDLAIKKAIELGQRELALLLQRQQRVATDAAAHGCNPDATYYDPGRNLCVTLVPCPEGQYFEPAEGQCIVPEEGIDDLLNSLGTIAGIPVWLLLLLGLVVISRSGDGKTVSFRRRS